MSLFLTQSSSFIIGPIAQLFGIIMNGIFTILNSIGIANIGICIIIFTIIVNILMIPITVKQQKFSRVQALMSPEIQAVQKKYKDKKNTASMQKMNEETQMIYDKYGTTPTGSCLPLLIQLPIIWGLYNVVLNVPAYVSSVKEIFIPLTDKITAVSGYETIIADFVTNAGISRVATDFSTAEAATNSLVDILYKCSTNGWELLRQVFTGFPDTITSVEKTMNSMNNFIGLNIANSPLEIIKTAFADGAIGLVILAILIPVLAAVTQFINTKLMPTSSNDNSSMANSMKTMNIIMPIFSAFLCLSFATGVGLYWIFNSVARGIIQLICNKKFDKIDYDELIAKNLEKIEKKREKKGISTEQMNNNARISTRNIKMVSSNVVDNDVEATPGSLREKANLVKKFNEKNSK